MGLLSDIRPGPYMRGNMVQKACVVIYLRFFYHYYRITSHIRPGPYIRYKAHPGLETDTRPGPYILRFFRFSQSPKVGTLPDIRPRVGLISGRVGPYIRKGLK